MKILNYILAAVVVALAVLLLRTGCQAPQVVEVVKWHTVNLDSLKATMRPDTVFVPGPERQVLRYVTVTIETQAQADSIAKAYAELANKYQSLETELQWAWMSGEGLPIDWEKEGYEYADSVTTDTYFHRWKISASGPVTAYEFGVQPICIPCPEVAPPAKKLHRVGLFAGGQTAPAGLRPVVGAGYGYGPIRLQAGVLPAAQGMRTEGQILLGLEMGLK